MTVARGDFDTLFDKLNTALTAYAAACTTYPFTVRPDVYRNVPASTTGAFAFPYFNGLTDGKKAGQTGSIEFDAGFFIDLVVFAKGTRTDGEAYSSADEAAGTRLRYLIVQVMDALWSNSNDLELRRLKAPSISPLPPERMNQMGERVYAAARLSFSAPASFAPSELAGTDLSVLTTTADLWSAYIEPETRE